MMDGGLQAVGEARSLGFPVATQADEVPLIALDMPFLLLPFRPTSDPSAARTFIRNYFDRAQSLYGEVLAQELRLTEPMVSFN